MTEPRQFTVESAPAFTQDPLATLAACGHLPDLEQAAAFNPAVLELLGWLPGRAP